MIEPPTSVTREGGELRSQLRTCGPQLLRAYGPLVLLGLLVVVISVVTRHVMSPAYSWNRDETVYLWHVDVLRSGQFTATDGGAPMFFQPWLTAASDGALLSQYTLGWPLVLLGADVVLGSPGAALALGALMTVLGTYAFAREITADHSLSLVAAGVMTASPILAIQGGLYLPYLFTLGLGLMFAAGLLSGVRRARPGRVVVSGALLGWIFLTRPYDAVLWGAAVLGYLALVRRAEWRRLLRATVWFAVGLLPLVVATFAYNRRVTGGFTDFPINATNSLGTLGFGPRRIMPAWSVIDFGPAEAIRGTAKNFLFLPWFLVGSYFGIVVAAVGLWLRRRERTTLALVALGASFPVGYCFFWGVLSETRYTGPHYYMPLYAPLAVLMATTIVAAWRRRRGLSIAIVVGLVMATLPFAVNRFELNRRMSLAQLPWKSGTDSIDDRALVFVEDSGPYLLTVNPYSANDPDLEGDVVYAADHGAANLDLIAAMPSRTPYVQRSSVPTIELNPRSDVPTPVVSVTRLEVTEGGVLSLELRVTNTDDSPIVAAYVAVGDHVEWRILATDSTLGAWHRTQWRMVPPGAAVDDPSEFVSLTERLGAVDVGVGYGTSVEAATTTPVARAVFSYRSTGTSIEVLTPGDTDRAVGQGGARRWDRADDLPELAVTVDSIGG